MFDLNWQPGPWISRISFSSQWDYCRAGQKNKKSYLGHGSAMIIGQDMLSRRLVHFTMFHSCVCHLLSDLNFELLKESFWWRVLCQFGFCPGVKKRQRTSNHLSPASHHCNDECILLQHMLSLYQSSPADTSDVSLLDHHLRCHPLLPLASSPPSSASQTIAAALVLPSLLCGSASLPAAAE